MSRTILLAGPSAAGKSTLARALSWGTNRKYLSTSTHLRRLVGNLSASDLFVAGEKLDREDPRWLIRQADTESVVDAIRSFEQHNSFNIMDCVRVNVVADDGAYAPRHAERGTDPVYGSPFMFNRPDFVWNSSRMSLATAVAAINQLAGSGYVDMLVGGQFGSEGKGKLAAILAPNYDVLVRSGGPNAGHWVRTDDWEYCYHHLPSGTRSNRSAIIAIAAGATLWMDKFMEEVMDTDCHGRLWVDRNAVIIEEADRERESKLVGMVGSTAQGVGSAQARRILRGLDGSVKTAADVEAFRGVVRDLAHMLPTCLNRNLRIMVEGTQGSMLSLYHGEYPFTTSRDTNVAGLMSEVGIAPTHIRNTWMVVRSLPIRVGGNSGPLEGEIDWGQVSQRANLDKDALQKQELTSTTKRQRRVGEFNWMQFQRAIELNRPTRLFLSFADYIDPQAAGIRDYAKLPDSVLRFCDRLEQTSGVPVAGVSTGRSQGDVCMRRGYVEQH